MANVSIDMLWAYKLKQKTPAGGTEVAVSFVELPQQNSKENAIKLILSKPAELLSMVS